MNRKINNLLAGLVVLAMASVSATAATLEFKDPTGDDNGPGTYIYPTDAVYSPGSFDITAVEITNKGKNMEIKVCVNSKLDDPWGMGVGFAVQMAFVFIDTDRTPGSGHTEGIAGTNIRFAPSDAWEKVVVLSPQQQSRVMSESKMKAADHLSSGDLLVPRKTLGKGKCISGRVPLNDVAPAAASAMNPGGWGYQVVMQSNEGFPAKTDLLTRKVNEFEGQHRFGGGHDMDCDPHVMDILAPPAKGGDDEIAAQHKMLEYECDLDGNAVKWATLEMVTGSHE
jgi:carbohydrate-binding DOMON domain-containing protein